MTKKTKTATGRKHNKTPELPLRAMHEIADWLLDLGRRNADGDHEDLATVERVRRAAHAAIDNKKYRTTERDLLTVVSLVVTAAERDFGITGLSDAMATSFDVLSLQPERPIATCPYRSPLVARSLRCIP
jgi:hypothetical protein